MALFDKILGKDEREEDLRKEVKSLELRKESVLAAIGSEIAALESEQGAVFRKAGRHAYDSWREGKAQADLTEHWREVEELGRKIDALRAKEREMRSRYEEEIHLIAGVLHGAPRAHGGRGADAPAASGAAPVSDLAFCSNCGSEIADGDLFCQNCGEKLQ